MRRASAGAKASYREAGWWVFRACPVPRYGVVHHQHYPLLVGIVLIHQFPYHPGPIGLGATLGDLHSTPPLQGCKQHEPVAHPVALVLVIVGPGIPGPRRKGLTGLPHQLPAGLVQAHQHFRVLKFAVIDLQHVLHSLPRTGYGGAHKVGTVFRRDAPALLQPKPAPLENGGFSWFFQRPTHRLRADARYYLPLDQPISQQLQRPTASSLRRWGAGHGNQSLPRTGYGVGLLTRVCISFGNSGVKREVI